MRLKLACTSLELRLTYAAVQFFLKGRLEPRELPRFKINTTTTNNNGA